MTRYERYQELLHQAQNNARYLLDPRIDDIEPYLTTRDDVADWRFFVIYEPKFVKRAATS